MLHLILDAGDSLGVTQKDPNGKYEWSLNNEVCNRIEKEISKYCNVTRLDSSDNVMSASDKVLKLEQIEADIKPDAVLSIHHNITSDKWVENKGISVQTSKSANKHTLSFASEILENMIEQMKEYNDYSSKKVSATKYPLCINREYPIVCVKGPFINNKEDNEYAYSEDGMNAYATAIVNSVISFFNLDGQHTDDEEEPVEFDDTNDDESDTSDVDNQVIQQSTTFATYYVKQSSSDSIKFKTTNLDAAIEECNKLYGYSVFSSEGNILHRSTYNKVIVNEQKKPDITISGVINNMRGASLKTENVSIALNQGANITIIKSLDANMYEAYIKINGEKLIGKISKKFVSI